MESSTEKAIASFLMPVAVVIDHFLGEPRKFHPLVGFGRLANRMETITYGPPECSAKARQMRGIAAVTGLLLPAWLISLLLAGHGAIGAAIAGAGLYLALGARSLFEHAEAVRDALLNDDLANARRAVGRIVSRDVLTMDAGQIAAATVESVLENGCDAVFGALFWYAAGGLPGVVVYRLANTLDAMWGYRNERYRDFGWAAARLDDVLNYLPARLTAMSYALCGHLPAALRAWRHQGRYWKSPNAGPVMAAGAGALGIALGGPASYHGSLTHRPALGDGRPAETRDIGRAISLVRRSLTLWLWAAVIGGVALA
ncbi:cobalamin biosynthesis protein CobD [Methylococcus capsulatus str. Bath]|uniref:Cobalamin biosynthesis protein CobD n=1 Tax=Methylococcus capsulatus (strain ATCC 33009 / NCIMB 11132 / Bath) TaxID=243233 RepID=Q605J5_METCA|nr:adenosylcobinamide-phosphate synthase CbiB [Methylococcus capsulatus]AAU91690.1 cobalamin biosynthesis protein CobD [Methylococcus capsulatus str. Bath]